MTPSEDGILDARDIVLSYGDTCVVDGLSTRITPGSFIGLIGPNGAGKTTLMLSLSGQFRPRGGQIAFEGKDIYTSNVEYKEKIGYVHERPFFYPHFRADEFLYFIAAIKKVPKDKRESQVTSVLESVCLIEERSKITSSLSLGMRRKLGIASALLGSPKLVFLDEALNGIDVESVFQIKGILTELVSTGTTIILATHVIEVIEKICDRYLVLKKGKIVADITAQTWSKNMYDISDDSLENQIIQILKSHE